jgi:hypothetical protein
MAKESPGLYSALNILDDDKSTVWCSAGKGKDAEIEILFSERTSLDRMDVATGNQISSDDFRAFSRVKEMVLKEGDMVHTVRLEDKLGAQVITFDPSLSAERLVLKIQGAYRGGKERHTCLSDVIFYKGKKAVNGKDLGKAVRKRVSAQTYMDTWVSGTEGIREREVVFGVSGTYRYLHVPNDLEGETVVKTGAWRLAGTDLEVQVDKKWIPVKVKRDDADRVIKLKIEDGLLAGVYERRKQQNTE